MTIRETAPLVRPALTDEEIALLTRPITTIEEQMDLVLGPRGAQPDDAALRDIVDRLAVYDVTYLWGGSTDEGLASPYHGPRDAPIQALIRDLVAVPDPRLRDALIAVLLRHPEHASAVRAAFAKMQYDDPARRLIVARLLAAAALQQIGGIDLTLDNRMPLPIDVADFVAGLGLPTPRQEQGEALLRGAADLLAGPYPVDWIDGWKDVLHHVLREVHWAKHPVGVP